MQEELKPVIACWLRKSVDRYLRSFDLAEETKTLPADLDTLPDMPGDLNYQQFMDGLKEISEELETKNTIKIKDDPN